MRQLPSPTSKNASRTWAFFSHSNEWCGRPCVKYNEIWSIHFMTFMWFIHHELKSLRPILLLSLIALLHDIIPSHRQAHINKHIPLSLFSYRSDPCSQKITLYSHALYCPYSITNSTYSQFYTWIFDQVELPPVLLSGNASIWTLFTLVSSPSSCLILLHLSVPFVFI